MPNIVANGISIYYEQRGSGPPLLFFNGSGSSLATSGLLVDVFAERLHVTAHDQRGLGRTEIPPGPYTIADYAADGMALLAGLGIDQCAVVGISFGGMVAQEFAIRYPQCVSRLALLCTSPGGPDLASYPLHELAALPDAERATRSLELLDTRFSPQWLADHPSDRFLVKAMAQRSTDDPDPDRRRGEHEQMQARRHHDVVDRLSSIAVPTFVAAGRYDGIAPPANAEAIAASIPGATLRIYEGGHAFFAQDPDAFRDVIGFLAAGH